MAPEGPPSQLLGLWQLASLRLQGCRLLGHVLVGLFSSRTAGSRDETVVESARDKKRSEGRRYPSWSGRGLQLPQSRAGMSRAGQLAWRAGSVRPWEAGPGQVWCGGRAGSSGLLQQLGHLHLSGQSRRLRGGGPRGPWDALPSSPPGLCIFFFFCIYSNKRGDANRKSLSSSLIKV